MNKRLAHILGVFVLVIFAVIFYDGWFNPKVLPALQQDGSSNQGVNNTVMPNNANQGGNTVAETGNNDGTTIRLLSLDDAENNVANTNNRAPAESAFSGLQGISNENPTQNHPIRLESLAAQETPVTANTQNTPAPQASATKGETWIQAGSFAKRENAEALAKTLQAKKIAAIVEAATINGAVYNRVYIGPMQEKEVKATLDKLATFGVTGRKITR